MHMTMAQYLPHVPGNRHGTTHKVPLQDKEAVWSKERANLLVMKNTEIKSDSWIANTVKDCEIYYQKYGLFLTEVPGEL